MTGDVAPPARLPEPPIGRSSEYIPGEVALVRRAEPPVGRSSGLVGFGGGLLPRRDPASDLSGACPAAP
eukprot:CAMPEP_0182552532 /NCGR_PEP_ID=MMETSP1323-20130603/48712_1 /TAXON_ID=236787 /ORGANISM="Florenciella parvula, Strain RCC1693" /LENGTH=68 /DNA_ID=CAMNT_0024764235 /DNA_START=121 /DNA_END=324 /DNA_ORIENTATION=-